MNGDTPLSFREASTLDYKKKTLHHRYSQTFCTSLSRGNPNKMGYDHALLHI
jgi:hypothetical protein